jgi:OFA family oxalate/formate antiporter-like MFS transporter
MKISIKKSGVLLIGFVLMLCAGLIFAWSIFVEPIERDLGFDRSQTSAVFTIILSISIMGQILAGSIVIKRSTRIPFLIAAILLAAGFFGASALKSIFELYLFLGIFCGLGIGVIYNAVMSSIIRQFPESPGLTSGLMLMGFGLGGLVLGSLSAQLLVSCGWRSTFRIFSLLFGGLSLAGSIVVGSRAGKQEPVKDFSVEKQNNDISPLNMIRDKSYVFFFMWAVLSTATSIIVIGHAALCAADIGANVKTAALATGVISIFNSFSRFIFGRIYDRKGHKVAMNGVFAMLLLATTIVTIAYTKLSVLFLFIGYAFVGVSYGSVPPILNSYIKEKFGLKYYGINLGITNLQMAVSSLLGPFIAGIIKNEFGTYLPAFYLMFGFTFLALLFSFGVKKRSK